MWVPDVGTLWRLWLKALNVPSLQDKQDAGHHQRDHEYRGGPVACVWAEMKAWKRAEHPVVGYWIHVGDLQLEEEGQLDWVPFKKDSGVALPQSGLGNYLTVQVPGCGYKELVHRQLWQDLSGAALPNRVEVHHRNHQYRDNRLVNLQVLPARFHRQLHR